jgi:hypothetical protein
MEISNDADHIFWMAIDEEIWALDTPLFLGTAKFWLAAPPGVFTYEPTCLSC